MRLQLGGGNVARAAHMEKVVIGFGAHVNHGQDDFLVVAGLEQFRRGNLHEAFGQGFIGAVFDLLIFDCSIRLNVRDGAGDGRLGVFILGGRSANQHHAQGQHKERARAINTQFRLFG